MPPLRFPAPAFSTICKSCGSIINTSKVVNSYDESMDELRRMAEEVPATLGHPYPAGKRMLLLLLDIATLGIAWFARTPIREKQKQSLAKKQAVYEERTRFIREKYRGKSETGTLARDVFTAIVEATKRRDATTLRDTLIQIAAIACILVMIIGISGRDKRRVNGYFNEIASVLANNDMGTAKAIISEMNEDRKLSEEVKQQARSRIAELDLQRQLASYDIDFEPDYDLNSDPYSDSNSDEITARINKIEHPYHRDILRGDVNRMKYETGMYRGWPSETLAGIKEISGAGATQNRRNDRMLVMEALLQANPAAARTYLRYTTKKDEDATKPPNPRTATGICTCGTRG